MRTIRKNCHDHMKSIFNHLHEISDKLCHSRGRFCRCNLRIQGVVENNDGKNRNRWKGGMILLKLRVLRRERGHNKHKSCAMVFELNFYEGKGKVVRNTSQLKDTRL